MIIKDKMITSDREAFDFVYDHLLEQNQISFDYHDEICCYHVENDGVMLACAVGCLIPDDNYSIMIERKTVDSDIVSAVVQESHPDWHVSINSIAMLRVLQTIHDRIDVENWKSSLDELKSLIFDDGSNEVNNILEDEVFFADEGKLLHEKMEFV